MGAPTAGPSIQGAGTPHMVVPGNTGLQSLPSGAGKCMCWVIYFVQSYTYSFEFLMCDGAIALRPTDPDLFIWQLIFSLIISISTLLLLSFFMLLMLQIFLDYSHTEDIDCCIESLVRRLTLNITLIKIHILFEYIAFYFKERFRQFF